LGYWFRMFSEDIVKAEASKTALARRYVDKCRDRLIAPLTTEQIQAIDAAIKGYAIKLVEQIIKELALPRLKATEVVLKDKSK